MATTPQSFLDLAGIKKLRSGKVREVFDLGETLLFVATDRLSAFDVILPDPIPHKGAVLNQLFTPATKSEAGHDLNIDWKECRRILGNKIATRARDLSLQIYAEGRDHAGQRGITVADTKFEFGIVEGELILIDECLTPDSSRFWPADQYAIGQSPPSFDKQFVRDYLETLDWRKTPPAPSLPKDVIAKTSAKYIEAFERLTSEKLL